MKTLVLFSLSLSTLCAFNYVAVRLNEGVVIWVYSIANLLAALMLIMLTHARTIHRMNAVYRILLEEDSKKGS